MSKKKKEVRKRVWVETGKDGFIWMRGEDKQFFVYGKKKKQYFPYTIIKCATLIYKI
jgi:hypothetical protein